MSSNVQQSRFYIFLFCVVSLTNYDSIITKARWKYLEVKRISVPSHVKNQIVGCQNTVKMLDA